MNNPQKLVVIGNGMVGHHFLEQLQETAAGQYQVTVFCEETKLAYDRVHLSSYFSGSTAADLALTTPELYAQWGLDVRSGVKAASIDRSKKVITASDGSRVEYDKIVLATGSFPFVPPVPGHDRSDCLVYRTLDDLDQISESAEKSKVGVVVGGGLLGLEAAKALTDLGLETHVVEFSPRLMAVQLDEDGGNLLRKKIEGLGVTVHTGKNTQLIDDGEICRHKMNFADGDVLETDLILFSAGIRPQDELARQCELEVGERGGIVVNNNCQTSDPDIYAIGECALWQQRIFGLVAPGYNMAKAAVSQLTGGYQQFTGADMSTKLKLMGVDVGSIGDAHGNTPDSLSYRYSNDAEQIYRRIVVSSDGKTLLGAVLVGDNSRYGTLLQYALNSLELPENPESLILPEGGDAAPLLGSDALPETATICSCLNVSKGDICQTIEAGACTIADVKEQTQACTGCGGCAALLKSVVDNELEKRGVKVNTDLCEHFAYTREELYHIVRVEGIQSFQELLEKHGNGLGCEICKPTVGSILASCWNDHIMEPQHVSLQDTNDTFMANMQKNGTYSIVPRIPGGEITPEKLIVIGEVARDYKLYTKITGGQRIDLFGAQLHQLPEIWGRLIDAGFETGHAYGKSMRTVKSCVGSTWCRYGVQDSVGMALTLENRYKGVRSPHKFKLAVSGCTRECAEAQSKDFGVIATENGWNLYVCGNGGMRPRHADLFATDLDDETLIKYIDRVLMFYIKTADRLQRTSVWMENLPGGLEYLREVVIEDSIGLGEELEDQMQLLVDRYQCEWKSAINDTDKLKRFRTFVNSEKEDAQILMIEERGQLRPAPATV